MIKIFLIYITFFILFYIILLFLIIFHIYLINPILKKLLSLHF